MVLVVLCRGVMRFEQFGSASTVILAPPARTWFTRSSYAFGGPPTPSPHPARRPPRTTYTLHSSTSKASPAVRPPSNTRAALSCPLPSLSLDIRPRAVAVPSAQVSCLPISPADSLPRTPLSAEPPLAGFPVQLRSLA
jgi:hypothetical protein